MLCPWKCIFMLRDKIYWFLSNNKQYLPKKKGIKTAYVKCYILFLNGEYCTSQWKRKVYKVQCIHYFHAFRLSFRPRPRGTEISCNKSIHIGQYCERPCSKYWRTCECCIYGIHRHWPIGESSTTQFLSLVAF